MLFFYRCLECDLVFSEPSRIPIRRRQTIFIILIMYGRVFPICRMRNGLALCARRLAIRFRWTGRKQRRKSLPLHFAPCLLSLFSDSFQPPSLSYLHVCGEKERGAFTAASDASRRAGGRRHRRSETDPVDCETCLVLHVVLALSLSFCPVQQ